MILQQPVVIVAIVAGMLGYAMMSLVMTATPLAMEACGFAIGDSAFGHPVARLAMFAPSFFTGHLIHRFGVIRIIKIGVRCSNVRCVVMTTPGIDFINFWLGLVFLGLAWNFMFIGAHQRC